MGMLGLNLPPGQMCVHKPAKSVCEYKRECGEGGRGGCYTRVPLHSKEIAESRGSVEDVLRFPRVNTLQQGWLCEQADGIGPASRRSEGRLSHSKLKEEPRG